MAKFWDKTVAQWQDAANFILGIWLFLSPWILGFGTVQAAAWNAWVVGIVIALLAAGALYAFQKWEEWLNVILGIWLVISPWVLGYSAFTAATWNAVIVGLIVLALAAWAAVVEHDTGHRVHG